MGTFLPYANAFLAVPGHRKYGAESWPAILFLSLVTALFLVPAALLQWKVS